MRRTWAAPALALVLASLVGVAVARRMGDDARPAPAPQIRTEVGEFGVELARTDPNEWREAFRSWRLPDPPSFDTVDIVPTRLALDAAQRWAQLGDGDALGTLGCIYYAFERHHAAVECFAAAAELGTQRERWLYMLGATCHQLQWLDGAKSAFELARSLDPKQALTHARLGDIYASLDQTPDALASFDTALKLQPDLSIAAVGRARVLATVGDLAQARVAAEGAVRAQPGDFAAHRTLADILARLGRHEEAAREASLADQLPRYQGWGTFDARIRAANRASRVQSHLLQDVDNAAKVGDLPKARSLCEELVARRPLDPSLHSMLGRLAMAAGDSARARTEIARAIELRPNALEYLLAKAEIEIAAQNAAEAVSIVEAALRDHPLDANCHGMLGRALFLSGRQQEGIFEARRAVELAPDDVSHCTMLLEIFQVSGLNDEAEALLADARRRDKTRAWAEQEMARRKAAREGRKP